MAHLLKIFCDFDSTVAVRDVGDEFFMTFGNDSVRQTVADLVAGRITPRECYELEFAALRPVREQDIRNFVQRQEIDPAFGEFVGFCDAEGIWCGILSDGFDFYIRLMLARNRLERVPVFANRLRWTADKATGMLHFEPEYPYTDSECDHCANCKRNHLLTLSGDDDIIVYIGDGVSDRCPVRYADAVFAKGNLVKHCQQENITYHRFATFRDVVPRLRVMADRKRMKKRREAEMRRRDVFTQG